MSAERSAGQLPSGSGRASSGVNQAHVSVDPSSSSRSSPPMIRTRRRCRIACIGRRRRALVDRRGRRHRRRRIDLAVEPGLLGQLAQDGRGRATRRTRGRRRAASRPRRRAIRRRDAAQQDAPRVVAARARKPRRGVRRRVRRSLTARAARARKRGSRARGRRDEITHHEAHRRTDVGRATRPGARRTRTARGRPRNAWTSHDTASLARNRRLHRAVVGVEGAAPGAPPRGARRSRRARARPRRAPDGGPRR